MLTLHHTYLSFEKWNVTQYLLMTTDGIFLQTSAAHLQTSRSTPFGNRCSRYLWCYRLLWRHRLQKCQRLGGCSSYWRPEFDSHFCYFFSLFFLHLSVELSQNNCASFAFSISCVHVSFFQLAKYRVKSSALFACGPHVDLQWWQT